MNHILERLWTKWSWPN